MNKIKTPPHIIYKRIIAEWNLLDGKNKNGKLIIHFYRLFQSIFYFFFPFHYLVRLFITRRVCLWVWLICILCGKYTFMCVCVFVWIWRFKQIWIFVFYFFFFSTFFFFRIVGIFSTVCFYFLCVCYYRYV